MGTLILGAALLFTVVISADAVKDLRKVPLYIKDKLYLWKRSVEEIGLEQVRKIPGYHDEHLHGDRKGQRSIRLNKAYRAIYVIAQNGAIKFVSGEEVNKHEY